MPDSYPPSTTNVILTDILHRIDCLTNKFDEQKEVLDANSARIAKIEERITSDDEKRDINVKNVAQAMWDILKIGFGGLIAWFASGIGGHKTH